jgi:hypothetical protein
MSSDAEKMEGVRMNLTDHFGDKAEHMEELVKHFEEMMDERYESFKNDIKNSLRVTLKKVSERLDALEQRVDQCEKTIGKLQKSNTGGGVETEKRMHGEIMNLKRELNRQAQYSRKDNVRIFGLAEEVNEDCRKNVSKMIRDRLKIGITENDISAAHRLPSKNTDKAKPMIVRLKDRCQRQEILRNRKTLKGSGISIAEDMTIDYVKLMNRSENSKMFKSVWFAVVGGGAVFQAFGRHLSKFPDFHYPYG